MNEHSVTIDAIRTLAGVGQPAVDISKTLYEHNCHYLLSKLKLQNEYTEKSQSELQYNALCLKLRYETCLPLFEMMERQAIPYAVIKGAVLSESAYGGINARKSGDIDILIRRDDINAVKDFMLQNGFIQGRAEREGVVPFTRRELVFQASQSHQAAPFIKQINNPVCPYINADVNMDIFWGESGRQSDMDYILSETETTEICGVTARKLAAVMEFIALCLHHYKDMNSIYLLAEGSLKLSLFCDIYFYLMNARIGIRQLKQLCDRLGVTEYVYYCVYYANEVFGSDLLAEYLVLLETDKGNEILYSFGLNDIERKTWSISFYERLFADNFKLSFISTLNEKDLKKINANSALF